MPNGVPPVLTWYQEVLRCGFFLCLRAWNERPRRYRGAMSGRLCRNSKVSRNVTGLFYPTNVEGVGLTGPATAERVRRTRPFIPQCNISGFRSFLCLILGWCHRAVRHMAFWWITYPHPAYVLYCLNNLSSFKGHGIKNPTISCKCIIKIASQLLVPLFGELSCPHMLHRLKVMCSTLA